MIKNINLYGQEVVGLKKRKRAAEYLAERFDLPEEAMPGAARVSVTEGRRLLVEDHRGITDYEPERIEIKLKRGRVAVTGSDLSLEALNRRELLIRGQIHMLEWLD